MDRRMHIQLPGHVREALTPRRLRRPARRHALGRGRLRPHGCLRRGGSRHHPVPVLPEEGPLRVRDTAPRLPGQEDDGVAGDTLRDAAVQAEGEVPLRQEHRHRGVRHLRPRMRVLLRREGPAGPPRDQAVLLRHRNAVGVRDAQGHNRRSEEPRRPPSGRLPPTASAPPPIPRAVNGC